MRTGPIFISVLAPVLAPSISPALTASSGPATSQQRLLSGTLREYASADVSREKIGSPAWALGPWKDFAYKKEIIKNWVATLAIWGEVRRHISVVGAWIWTKFGSLIQNNVRILCKWLKSKRKVDFQYGGRLFFKNGSTYISAVNWGMSTKFGLLTDFDLLVAVTSKKHATGSSN